MNANKRIAIIVLFSNGDCLLASPVAEQIKKDFPNCHLTWIVSSFSKHLLINNPNIDHLEINDEVKKTDLKSYRKLKKKILLQKQQGVWDEVFFIQNMDENMSLYDGSIRSMLLNAYPKKLEVDIVPKVYLNSEEELQIDDFINKAQLKKFKNVILFEFAPQSGQLNISVDGAMKIAHKIVNDNEDTAIIMSSSIKIESKNEQIIDGSILGLRATGALLKHCTLVLGCSSGISWLSTSNLGHDVPLVQIIDPNVEWVNPMSRDFEWFKINQPLIEIYEYEYNYISDCVIQSIEDFSKAKTKYNKPLPIHFKTTSKIVYNLLCYGHFISVLRHFKTNFSKYGFNVNFILEFLKGFILFPYYLGKNKLKKINL